MKAWRGISALLLAAVVASPAWAIDAPHKEDRIRFIVHDLVSNQISAQDLGSYLDSVGVILQRSQAPAIDVPTCTDLGTLTDGSPPPFLFTSNGGLASSLAVIDNESELIQVLNWGAMQGSRVGIFVQDIRWCGAPLPNTIGCAPAPGNVFVISLTAAASVRAIVIAHERGHNAGLLHRSNDTCALMRGTVASSNGCLDNDEAQAFYDQAGISTGGVCHCIDVQFMGPNQTWSLKPQFTSCDDGDACTATSACNVGLCQPLSQVDCDDSNVCTAEDCDPLTGCFNPPIPDGTPCLDRDLCNGSEQCASGSCAAGTPLTCDDSLFCNGMEGCNATLGCQAGAPPPLDDGVGCTLDSCDEVDDEVDHVPDDGFCDNLAFCDGDETCSASLDCQPGTPPPTDDGVDCTDDSCDEAGDTIVHAPNAALCDDADACTAESCDEISGCAHDPIPGCGASLPASSSGTRVLLLAALALVAGVRLRRGLGG